MTYYQWADIKKEKIPDNYYVTCLHDLNLEKEVKVMWFTMSDDYKVEVVGKEAEVEQVEDQKKSEVPVPKAIIVE